MAPGFGFARADERADHHGHQEERREPQATRRRLVDACAEVHDFRVGQGGDAVLRLAAVDASARQGVQQHQPLNGRLDRRRSCARHGRVHGPLRGDQATGQGRLKKAAQQQGQGDETGDRGVAVAHGGIPLNSGES